MGFIYLLGHFQYRFLDDASSLDKLWEKVKMLDMPALALTDHDRLTGAIMFYQKAKTIGMQHIIGAESL